MRRREFLRKGVLGAGGALCGSALWGCRDGKEGSMTGVEARVMTVAGPIAPGEMGLTLPHEHVMVDFIGEDKVSRDRYDADEVCEVALPHLKHVRSLGCRTLVDCTPAYIGRDAALLKRLSSESGLTILTNTGYYGAANDKFVPVHAYGETADELADRWVREWEEGIEDTAIRPGFIKIGVDAGPLSEIDRKLVVAAGHAHLRTGLSIAAHTGNGKAAEEQLSALRAVGVDGSAWIWVHAQSEGSVNLHAWAAEQGAWLEFDGIGPDTVDRHVSLAGEMKVRGHLDRVLVSHDAGWYNVGHPGGGTFRPYDTLFMHFIPALKEAGFSDEEIRRITVENPARAFTMGVRARA